MVFCHIDILKIFWISQLKSKIENTEKIKMNIFYAAVDQPLLLFITTLTFSCHCMSSIFCQILKAYYILSLLSPNYYIKTYLECHFREENG